MIAWRKVTWLLPMLSLASTENFINRLGLSMMGSLRSIPVTRFASSAYFSIVAPTNISVVLGKWVSMFAMSFISIMQRRINMASMQFGMRSVIHYFKIGVSVVCAMTIFMMDYFRFKQRPTKSCLYFKTMHISHLSIYFLNQISFLCQRRPWLMNEQCRVSCTKPSVIMDSAPSARYGRFFTYRTLRHSGLILLLSVTSCQSKPAQSIPASDATVQCQKDCIAVSKAFVKEHANLFNEVIRTKAALEDCRKK